MSQPHEVNRIQFDPIENRHESRSIHNVPIFEMVRSFRIRVVAPPTTSPRFSTVAKAEARLKSSLPRQPPFPRVRLLIPRPAVRESPALRALAKTINPYVLLSKFPI